MKTHIFFLAVFTLLSSSLFAQKLTFEVYKGKEVIGSLEAWKHSEGANSTFALQQQVSPFSAQSFSLTANYENGKLVSAISRNLFEDEVQTSTSVKWDGETYHVLQDATYTALDSGPAPISTASLYFHEPSGKKRVFSETDGKFLSLKQFSDHTYGYQLPNGDKHYFTYENGACVEVKWVQPLRTVIYKLTDSQTFAAF